MAQQIDIIEFLERDHRRINDLVEHLDKAEDTAEIRGLYLRLVEELTAHEALEQQVLFPAFHAAFSGDADNTLAHRMGEHEEMNEMLAEMRNLAPDGFAFIKRGSALLLEIKSHFLIEEETVFARMKQGFAADELVELARQALIHV
jgi:iron-sulfur cluster repair protein YtfE (RIC family)